MARIIGGIGSSHSPTIGFAVIELLCLAVLVLGIKGMARDDVLTRAS